MKDEMLDAAPISSKVERIRDGFLESLAPYRKCMSPLPCPHKEDLEILQRQNEILKTACEEIVKVEYVEFQLKKNLIETARRALKEAGEVS